MSEDFSKLSGGVSPAPYNGARIAFFVLFVTVLLFFTAEVVSSLLLSVIPAARHWSSARTSDWLANSVVAQFAYVLIADGLLVSGIAGVLKLVRWQWKTIGLVTPRLRHIALGVAAVALYYVLYLAVVYVLSALIPSLNIGQKQNIGFTSVHGIIPLLLTFTSLVIIPPIAEEIAMRGFLYTGLRKWLPKFFAALVVSALFGAAHLMEGGAAGPLWIGAIDTFTLSLVLVALREKTGNLWAGITLHALKNGVAFLLLFIIGGR